MLFKDRVGTSANYNSHGFVVCCAAFLKTLSYGHHDLEHLNRRQRPAPLIQASDDPVDPSHLAIPGFKRADLTKDADQLATCAQSS